MRALALLAFAGAGCSQILGIGGFSVGDGGNDGPNDAHVVGQRAYLKASTIGAGDQFGAAVAASADGSTIVVSAPLEDSAAMGVGGNEADNTKADSGAIYVFVRSGSTWTQQAYLKASNTDATDAFGRSVAISDNGNTIVVGADKEDSSATGVGGLQTNVAAGMDSGAAYVFARTGTTWAQTAYLKPLAPISISEDFGFAVAISGDGAAIAVGAPLADNGAANAGAVFTYTLSGVTWVADAAVTKASNPDTGDNFGSAVALSTDGSTLAVGAPTEDSAATGLGGLQASNAAVDAGAVYVFARSGAAYAQQQYVKASNTDAGDQFGHGVGLSGDGNTLVVGALGEASASTTQTDNSAMQAGAGYVFTRVGTTWSQTAYLKASNAEAGDNFGAHVAVASAGSAFAITAPLEDGVGNAVMDSGAVYLFTKAGTMWTETYLAADTASAGDKLEAVGMLGATPVAGSVFEDSASATQPDEAAVDSGAAYVFE